MDWCAAERRRSKFSRRASIFDYANRKQHVREIADWFQNSGVPLHSVHSPMYADYEGGRAGGPPVNVAATDRAQRIEAMDEIKRAIEVAEQIPFRFLVQHMGTSGESFDDRKFEAAMTSIEHLRAFAKPLGVRILLENIPNELSTPDKLVEFIQITHFDDMGVCFDVGHAHIMGNVAEAFEILKRPYSLDARPRQRRRPRFASLAGSRKHRLEGSDGVVAVGAEYAAVAAGDRSRREGESGGEDAESVSRSWKRNE